MRIVSLVPSLTDAVATLGLGAALVGVTQYCTDGAPPTATRIGGTKNPDPEQIVALHPDLVLGNTEENKPELLEALRTAGLTVEEFYPRGVNESIGMVRRLGEVLGRTAQGEQAAERIERAWAELALPADRPRVMALTLVWRKPWMGLGPDTYADDLLWQCGFANVLSGFDERYPNLDASFMLGADVVLLPSEPYEFGTDDLAAVGELAGAAVPTRLIDGQALTWHGPRTAEALATFGALAADLAG